METREVLRQQQLSQRPTTVDEEARTVELELATEAAVNGLVFRCSTDAVNHAGVVNVLLDHRNETSAIAGRLLSIRSENGVLVGLAEFKDAPAAETGWLLARRGCPTSIRAMYRLDDVVMGIQGQPDVVNLWRMGEVSLVAIGADLTTTRSAPAETVATESPNIKDDEKDSSMADANKSSPGADQAETTATATVDETRSVGAPAGDGQTAEQIRKAEQRRTTDIMERCRAAGLDLEFAQGLISNGATAEAARDAIIDAMVEQRKAQPGTLHGRVDVVTDHGEKRLEAMRHALEARSSVREWGDGGAREYVGSTLLDMARECVERSGTPTRGMSKSEVAIRAMHSTTDFPLLMTSIQRVTMKAAYDAERQTWQIMASREDLPDFRDMSVIEVGGTIIPEELKEGGEYKAGTIKEAKGGWRISEYGSKIVVGRRLIINDNLGHITKAVQVQGRGVAILEANMVWALLTTGSLGATCTMDSKALFHADHNNTGTGAIGEASISDARKKMRNQKSFDGTTLYVEPRYILLPTELETAFDKFNTTIVPNQTSNVNIFSGALQKVVEARLDAKSLTQFYLVGDYAGVDKIVYGYLQGEGGPSIEQVSARDPDGITSYLRHDFGCHVPQHQAFYRSSGQ